YFNFRPNDFLKIEVIKWALENNITHYVLGGGRQNNDGLFQYKKAFFPKDDDAVFYTGRKVINHKVYKKLTKTYPFNKKELANLINHGQTFFPIYRSKTKE